jgi:MoxR-like ATPase
VVLNLRREHPINALEKVAEAGDLLALQNQLWDVHVDDTLQDYIIRLVEATRRHPDLALGASPRASLALFKTSQALAAIRGRDHVLPDDLKFLAPAVLTHRLIVRPEAELRGRTASVILREILENTKLELEAKSDK